MIKVIVVLGKAECSAASKGLPHDSKLMEFNTAREAEAYMQGLADAHGWEEAAVEIQDKLDVPPELNWSGNYD